MEKNNYSNLIRDLNKFLKKAKWKHSKTQDVYKNHLLIVRNFALKLAKLYKADKQVVEISALLHDIAYTKIKDNSNHEIVSADMAKKILKDKLPKRKIELISKCIMHHRGAKDYKRESIEEKIIACSDAMCHISKSLNFIYLLTENGMSLEDSLVWLKRKVKRGWKKITLKKAREIIKDKYLAILCLLDDIKDE